MSFCGKLLRDSPPVRRRSDWLVQGDSQRCANACNSIYTYILEKLLNVKYMLILLQLPTMYLLLQKLFKELQYITDYKNLVILRTYSMVQGPS